MTIDVNYSLRCTDCNNGFFEHGTGSWVFDDKQEVIDAAKRQGWSIAEEVFSGSKWDFCPRCLEKRRHP